MPRAKASSGSVAAPANRVRAKVALGPIQTPEVAASYAVAMHRYPHKVMVWLGSELSDEDRVVLKQHCHSFRQFKHGHWYRDSDGTPVYQLNNHPFTHCVELIAPRTDALLQLGKRNHVSVTISEMAQDYIFNNADAAYQMHRAYNKALVQRYNYDNERKEFANGGTSTGRRSGMYQTWYHDEPSRLTNDPYCFHHEIRVNNGTKMRSLGISGPTDLANLDFDQFFAKYCTMFDVDFERLGRYHRNKYAKTKSRVDSHPKNNNNGKHAHYYNTQRWPRAKSWTWSPTCQR